LLYIEDGGLKMIPSVYSELTDKCVTVPHEDRYQPSELG
jgi:hypothetical protein